MESPWFDAMRRQTRLAAAQAVATAPYFQTFGQVIGCVDRRCVPVCGATPFKRHGILGAHVNGRNGVAVAGRLEHDARRAARMGKPQLVILEFHSDCAYRRRTGLNDDQLWADASAWCRRLPNTTVVRCTRDTATGALTFYGPRHTVEAASIMAAGQVDAPEPFIENLLCLAGFTDPVVAGDLARCVRGNLAHLRRAIPPLPQPSGVVVGTGVAPAATHFSVSNRFETDLKLALGIALDRISASGTPRPEIAVAVARHPQRRHQQDGYVAALRSLKAAVQTALRELDGYGAWPLHTLFADKGIGELVAVKV